ncbi:BolA family transcriptional regulator [Aliiroseovarius zhejiangensis]|uniref:BolA family transcriptional regulator n=1 Tax=Aliiroseovarius zhejiangensis TaxID=1632025 RepID=A0ABQ3IK55_9RHOB|nr:BolA family protein [Aliiroseovarius zhejiangensis]GHE86231.1 BolA family transcriptional regulator [Aliiroseovarius zhejiangensis]
MTRADQIAKALHTAFAPQHLEVIDESEMHRGHAGYQEGGQSHFRVVIRAPAFGKMSRVARHRAVHAALGPELVGQIHALALDISD